MFEEILMSALSEFDDDTLNYILESCTEDELSYLEMAIEDISYKEMQQLQSGYKLDVHNGVKGFVKSFKNSGADKWKNLAHDAKTEFTRIKNNLRGEPENTSLRLADKDVFDYQNDHDEKNTPNFHEEIRNKYNSNKDAQRNAKSLSYKIGQKIEDMKSPVWRKAHKSSSKYIV